MIIHEGSINTTALIVPDIYVQLIQPKIALLNGVPTNVLGIVGTAAWGPVGVPTVQGSYSDFVRQFGALQARKYDLGTAVAIAHQQGATNFRCVRVTDGTDVSAQVSIQAGAISITSRYTGSLGNRIRAVIAPGSRIGTWRVSVFLPEAGYLPEVFDNISGTGAALWANMATAINNGQNNLRSRSEIVVATAGASSVTPTANTYTLAGGSDGAGGVVAATLLGQDSVPRRGMFALRGSGASVAMLADCDDSATWATQITYGRSEGTYMVASGPAGETITGAVEAKSAAGIDDWSLKLMLGDWCYWNDTVNGLPNRLVSPQAFAAGLLANLSPHHSALNKQVFGVVGTQRGSVNAPYSNADLQVLGQAGIDVVTNPVPGGKYFGVRFGRNTSSNPMVRGDNYTRMTNYIAATLNEGMGRYVGRPHSAETRRAAKATLDAFFQGMAGQGMIGNAEGTTPWQTILDSSNNPQPRVAQGYMQADLKVQYLSIIEFLVANMEGGQGVVIERRSTTPDFS